MKLFDDLLGCLGLPVELSRRHDFDRVGDGDDARAERDRGLGDAIGVARAVPALVVMAHDRPRSCEQVERLEQLVADLGVGFHDSALFLVQRARLQQDPVGDPDLADVVEDCAEAHGFHFVGR